MIKWMDSLSVGIERIDEQHKELIKRINDLFDVMNQQKSKEEVSKVVNFLEQYVIIHFSDEEAYMKKIEYDDIVKHKSFHAEFIENFNNFKKLYEKESSYVLFASKLQTILCDWLINHIGNQDRKIGVFVRNKAN